MDDGTFELAESEGVVGAAAEAALDGLDHGTVLRSAGRADELGIAPGLGQRVRIRATMRATSSTEPALPSMFDGRSLAASRCQPQNTRSGR